MAGAVATPSAQDQFVTVVADMFQTGRTAALEVYTKLRSFTADNAALSRIEVSTQGDFDDLSDRVARQLVGMNLRAIVRSVVVPLFGGVLVAVALVALEVPALAALSSAGWSRWFSGSAACARASPTSAPHCSVSSPS
jgi:hypothetical protein